MAITRKQSLRLRERDAYCLHCGADDGLQVHHRRNRAMGGSKLLDTFENLLRVCPLLNYQMESDADVAREARQYGWKLGQWDAFDMPVFDKIQQKWFLLTPKGDKVETDAPSFLI